MALNGQKQGFGPSFAMRQKRGKNEAKRETKKVNENAKK
jgi:hypothetical protein